MTSSSGGCSCHCHAAPDSLDEALLDAMGPDEISSQLRDLDEQISRLQSKKVPLSRRINRHQPIFSLPSETLVQIFAYFPTAIGAGPVCYTFSHVCHHWREISLDSALLWNTFTAQSYAMAMEMITRSKSAPLFIRISLERCMYEPVPEDDSVFPSSVACLHPILGDTEDTSRIKHLELLIHNEFDYSLCASIGATLPVLHTLNVVGDNHPDLRSTILDEISDGSLPSLRAMDLHRVNVSLTSSFFRGLQSFHLEGAQYLVSDFLRALTSMYLLEDLHLEYAFARDEPDILGTMHVSLPRIRHLYIIDHSEVVCKLLELVSVPPSAVEDIDHGPPWLTDVELADRRVGIALAGHVSASTKITRLAICECYSAAMDLLLNLHFWTTEPAIGRPNIMLRIGSVFNIPSILSPGEDAGWAKDATCLEVSGSNIMPPIFWNSLSRCVPLVHTIAIDVQSETAYNLIRTLEATASDAARKELIFPALETLVLRPSERGEEITPADSRLTVPMLEEFLVSRRAAGAPIRTLRLGACAWIAYEVLHGIAIVLEEADQLGDTGDSWKPCGCDNRVIMELDESSEL